MIGLLNRGWSDGAASTLGERGGFREASSIGRWDRGAACEAVGADAKPSERP